ncbi:hypothetical protein [Pseudomonas syringae]|uniref:hypothetical protein n=3 Tax=Pseudomonas syringae TaxID=317 RepID=UPI000A67CB66|nr:hypothetical protein [Pseudomonas syringae]MCK0548120.1 hypothetical protein [Pseudomonas syringae pv. aptata]
MLVIFTSYLLVLFQGNFVHSTTVVGLTVEAALGQERRLYPTRLCSVPALEWRYGKNIPIKIIIEKILIDARLRFTLHSQSSVYT